MSTALLDALRHALRFESGTRLFRLQGDGGLDDLLVETWALDEALDRPWTLELSVLGLDVALDLSALVGRRATLVTALAGGGLAPRTGIVFAAEASESDGGFARFRLTLRPWTALLAHARRSRVWQEKTTVEILEDVFRAHAAHAQWRFADDVDEHLAQSPWANAECRRSYTVQYRETDLAFATRLLAEEGLACRIEEDEDAPAGHTLVVFADSPSRTSCPEDPTSEADGGIRFHRDGAVETRDAVQAFGGLRTLQSATTAVLAWNHVGKRSQAATVPTSQAFGGANAPRLEAYHPVSADAFAGAAQAERAATLRQEAIEARNKAWLGRSTVRTLRPGTHFTLTESPLDLLGDEAERTRFLVTAVVHAGLNNLPKEMGEAVAGRAGSAGSVELLPPWVDAEVRAQALATGYGNRFEATRALVPWRPEPGRKPRAPGALTAEVVGDAESGASEICTDRIGRVRIRHAFQPRGEGSTWVRVLQPYAGAGMGLQFIPRIGQTVLVDFLDDDIDRPYVKAALYDGRGEGGVAATPGGKAAESDTSVFASSTDAGPSGQGNLAGGRAPAWHGAAPGDIAAGGQRNAAALSGWKTKEFGGDGYNQLVFDDSNRQLRTQLSTTAFSTQLNLGHLIHQADNHRGSFRGPGFELRSDAYGVVRGARGVLLSTYGTTAAEPAGDDTGGIALASQWKTLSKTFSDAAKTHQTVALAADIGSWKATQSALSDKESPAPALQTSLKGMVSAESLEAAIEDASSKSVATGEGKLPHLADPIVAIAARGGLAVVAGQDVAVSAGETAVLASGEDLLVAAGGAARVHAGQAIGVLGGAIGPGDQAAGKGLTLIAGKGDLELQAQADTMQIAAKQDVQIQSKSAHVDWAAAKKITLATAGGASIVIEGGNITVMCPGTITVKAAKKSFVGPAQEAYGLPLLPSSICVECLLKAAKSGAPFAALQ